MGKICFFCGSNNTTKKGFAHGHQRWLCKACNRYFSQPKRDSTEQIHELYASGRFCANDIAKHLGVSRSTVTRAIKAFKPAPLRVPPSKVVAMLDTSYWGREFGVVAIKDSISGRFLWSKFITRKERVEDYIEGIRHLVSKGFQIAGVVSDGLRGLREALASYNFQHCQFHQVKTIKHWLTSHPKLDASRELLRLAYFMRKTDKASFVGLFNEWEAKWTPFLKERSIGADGKSRYVHKNLRSAYHSLKRNMRYLWTFEDCWGQGIPNTNNGIEAAFGDLKSLLRRHKGISIDRRKALILEYFSGHNPYK